MTYDSFSQQLDLLENQFTVLGASLVDGEPAKLQAASAQIQQLTVDLIQMADDVGRATLRAPGSLRRLQAMSIRLAAVRENLLRQSAYVDQALALVVPESRQKATYPGARTYGGPVRQSGAFSVLSA